METLLYKTITAIGWSMLHSIWQGAILYILLCIAMLALPKMHARGKFNLAFIFQGLLVVGFISSFSYYYQLPLAETDSLTIHADLMDQYLQQLPQHAFSLETLFPYLFIIYLLGLGIQMLLLTRSFLQLRKLKYKGLHGSPLDWQAQFEKTKALLGISGYVPLFLSQRISVPITIGFIKPVVLFPLAYANQMAIEQVEAILLHELAHIKRKDYLLNLIKVTIETMLFFNPFTWAFSKIMEREREHACDDMVLELVDKPLTYAHALVELETLRQENNHPLSMAATGRNNLFKRIKRITKMETNYISVKQQLLALLISSVALISLVWLLPSQELQAAEPEKVQLQTVKAPLVPLAALSPVQDTTKKKKAKTPQVIVSSKSDSLALPKEVQAKLKSIEEQSKDIEKHFNSPEWKERMAFIEKNAQSIHEHFNSPEWKEKIEKMTQKIEAQFDSPEWKAKMKEIEKQGKEIEKYYNSPEWKEKIAKIEREASKVEAYFESPQWKEKIKKIEETGKDIDKYFKSEEWKKKEKELKALQNSTEL